MKRSEFFPARFAEVAKNIDGVPIDPSGRWPIDAADRLTFDRDHADRRPLDYLSRDLVNELLA